MTYYVQATTLNTFNAERIENTESFNSYKEALDYYRDTFKNQSELIVDLGGTHVITMYTNTEDGIMTLKRQTIDTTINNLVEND